MIKNLKTKFNKETVFFIGIFLYLFQNFLRTTTFVDIIPSIVFSVIKYAGLGLLLLKAVFLDNYSINTILVTILFLFISLFSFYFSSEQVILVMLFIIFSCKGIEYRKILKLFLLVEIPLLLVTILFSKLGLIENLVYNRDENTLRQSLGVVYPTDFAAHVYFIMLAYITYLSFKDKQITIYHYIVFTCIALIVYKYTDARLDVISMLMTLIVVFLFDNKILKFKWTFIKYPLIISFIICAFISLFFTFNYNKDSGFYFKLDKLLSGRLRIGHEAYEEYGVGLFGSEIDDHGWGGSTEFEYEEYNFLDSSFIRITLKYGFITLIAFSIFNCYFCNKLYNKKQYMLLLASALIFINSIIAQHYLDFSYNFLLMSYCARLNKKQE